MRSAGEHANIQIEDRASSQLQAGRPFGQAGLCCRLPDPGNRAAVHGDRGAEGDAARCGTADQQFAEL